MNDYGRLVSLAPMRYLQMRQNPPSNAVRLTVRSENE
jgi:hypothetical protein